MRSHEFEVGSKKLIYYELSFPDDFDCEAESSELIFGSGNESFIAPPLISGNLRNLANSIYENNKLEYGLIRVESEGKRYFLRKELMPLRGTNDGLSYDVYEHEFYETHVLPKSWKSISIIDFFHSHTVGDFHPAVSNLFSPSDISEMGSKFAKRYWVTGHNGASSMLLNYRDLSMGDEFKCPAMTYQEELNKLPRQRRDISSGKFDRTYARAMKAFLECVDACGLWYFASPDLINYYRVK